MPVARRTLLLGWEAADLALLHPLLDAGRLPHLRGLMEAGATGGLGTLAPLVPETHWTSVATGCLPQDHGVLATGRPAADGVSAEGFARRDWGRRAVWDVFAEHGWRAHVLGWPATHPAKPPAEEVTATGGVFASDRHFSTADAPPDPDASWPAPAGGVFPTAWAEDLAELRVHPGELGAAQWRDFLPQIMDDDARATLAADPRVARLAHRVAETAGLAFAAGHVLENAPWDFAAVRFGLLEDICRDFGADHGGPGPFGAVVGAAHVLLDTALGTLLGLAGPDANVLLLSTHGYLAAATNGRAPGAANWDGPARHRPRGFAVLRGPGVRRDALFDGGHLLGAVPTLLAMNDLPIGADLPGRVWSQAFEKPPGVRVLPSLERPPATPRAAPTWTQETAGSAPGSPAELAGRELRYGLAVAHLATGQPAAALPWLERARREDPSRLGPAIHLITTLHALGQSAESRALLEKIAVDPPVSFSGHRPQFDLMRGVLDLAEGRPAEALVHLRRARRTGGLPGPEMHRQLGEVYLALHRWREAAGAFARALRFDPDDAVSHLGRAAALYRRRRFPRAGEHARQAATLAPELARAHLLFGLCLARAGRGERAVLALRHAVARQPGFGLAHRVLARLLARSPETAAAAALHRQMGRCRK